jgi:hypothetical protein
VRVVIPEAMVLLFPKSEGKKKKKKKQPMNINK